MTRPQSLLLVTVGAIILGVAYMFTARNISLGYRANNPMDVVYSSSNDWVGQIGTVTSSDGSHTFCKFDTMGNGIRCGAHVILGYQINDGLWTCQQIADKYAPTKDQNPSDYGEVLAKKVGVGPDDQIVFNDYLESIIRAIVSEEQTIYLVTDVEYAYGIQSARTSFGLA